MRNDLQTGVTEKLDSYVYIYVDPETEKPFYIGKGTGDRFLAHLDVQPGTAKGDKINEIKGQGKEPRIDFLRWGLSEAEANLVEAAAIDLIGKENLVNLKSGHHPSHGRSNSDDFSTKRTSKPENTPGPEIDSEPKGHGRITSKDLITMVAAEKVTVDDAAILITINKLYRSNMSPLALKEATRGIWVLDPRRANKAKYAMAVFQGVVREVYLIKEWHKSGTLTYKTRDDVFDPDRWEFSGEVAPEKIREKYIDKFVGKGRQNPIHYVNVPR